MAVELPRRCGYRKVGGLYLVANGTGMACGRLPVPLTVCPVCNHGIKQTRSWQWVDAAQLLGAQPCGPLDPPGHCDICPLSPRVLHNIGKAGLLWIGEQYYPTVESFHSEAAQLGISRRISAVPRGFRAGETWVLLAHPLAVKYGCPNWTGKDFYCYEDETKESYCSKCEGTGTIAGVFRVFRPSAIEKIVTESQASNVEEMEDLRRKGITPVVVPDDDADHQKTSPASQLRRDHRFAQQAEVSRN